MKKLFLLDAYALIYRAHYALIKRPLINTKGINTSAIHGFVNTLLDVLQKENPTHLAVAFDLPTPTFRHELFPEYKANREAQPEDITIAIPLIQTILQKCAIPVLTCEGYEADDVIGTVAKQAEQAGYQVYMMTPDKDYAQLVSDNIFLFKPAHFGNDIRTLGKADILADWGIQRVEQVIDFLGLKGDSVDNIPGVKGIGDKTAQSLLAQFGSIEEIYDNLHQLKGKVREQLERDKANALLSKQLATIDINVPIAFHEESFAIAFADIDKDAVVAQFNELEFRSLSERFLKYYRQHLPASDTPAPTSDAKPTETQLDLFGNVIESAAPSSTPANAPHRIVDNNITNTPHTYHIAQTLEACVALASELATLPRFAFDTETTGLDTHTAQLVGMSFSWAKGTGWYVPVPAGADAQPVVDVFRSVLENPTIDKIGQNLKYDMAIMANYGVHIVGNVWDTMLMHYVLEPEKRHNLDYMSESYLRYAPVAIETLIGKKGKNQLSMRDIALEKIAEYATEDADVTFQLYEYFDPQLQGEQRTLYTDIEAPLVRVLTDMEQAGVRIDVPFLEEYKSVLQTEIAAFEKSIFDAAGVRFNLNSPAQVGDVLFEKLQIPYRWKLTSKNKQYSTDEEKLTELADEHPIIQDILTYRQLAKLQSTYVEALPALVNSKTGRVHSSFNQALTATGRLSSQNPNLQNIPIRSERGKEIRKAFIAKDENHVLLAADYSQIELRLMAAMSGDAVMCEAFQQGIDIHTATAARIYNVALSEVSKQQRYAAKTVNFSIIYGAGASNLAKQLDIKRSDAAKLIEQYYEQYSGLKAYMERAVDTARQQGFVTTLCGRRRYLRDLHSQNSLTRSHAERNAINTPIQGTAADMIKIAMIHIHQALQAQQLQTRLILQVHDELLFDVPLHELDRVRPLIETCMQNALPNLSVPIEVGIGVGSNWLEAH